MTSHSAHIIDDSDSASRRLVFYGGMLVICVVAWWYRLALDDSSSYLREIYLERFYQGYMDRLLATKPWWYFFLPMPDIKGVWATTGFVLIFFLERALGPNVAYLLLQASATVGVALGMRLATNRTAPALCAAMLFAFSPFNYSVYLWNGSNNAYTTVLFLSLAFGCFAHYILHAPRRRFFVGGAVTLTCAALSYEAWLDFLIVLIFATPVLLAFSRHFTDRNLIMRYLQVFGVALGIGALYILIRFQTLHATAIPGLEFQLIWTHASVSAMVDDFVFNTVFLSYLALMQFLPGWLGASAAIYSPGQLDVEVLQNGYVPELYPLVAQHYLNLWMLYAGAAYVASAAATLYVLRLAYRTCSLPHLAGTLLGIALLIGSPTHALLKFVAFNAVPFYSYKSTVTVWLLCMGIGFFAARILQRLRGPVLVLASSLFIAYVFLVAFTRPYWANENVREIWGDVGFFGNGFYPDPWHTLQARFRN